MNQQAITTFNSTTSLLLTTVLHPQLKLTIICSKLGFTDSRFKSKIVIIYKTVQLTACMFMFNTAVYMPICCCMQMI